MKPKKRAFFLYIFWQRLPQCACDLYECMCVHAWVFKGTARGGSFLFICVSLLEKKKEEETKLNWSAALHVVQKKERQKPAQHVAHNGLGGDGGGGGGWRASLVPPFYVFIFLQHCRHPTGKWTSSVFFFNKRDSHLTLATKVHLALIPNAHQK